jgi:hypothetical protein
MLKQYIFNFLLAGLLFFSCTFAEKKNNPVWNGNLSVEENIASQAIALQNDTAFLFLDELAKTRSVIILGEAGHGDFTTIQVKRKMEAYLLEKGFNSLAYEGYPFLSSYLISNSEYSSFTKNWGYEFEENSTGDKEIFRDMRKLLQKNIKTWGIDVYGGRYDIDAVQIILDKYLKEEPFSMEWEKLKDYYYRKFIHPVFIQPNSAISVGEQVEMMRMIDSIVNYVHYLMHKKGKTNELSALLQWVRNVNANYSFAGLFENNVDMYNNLHETVFPFRNRDSQIAENILWITEYFPKEKFIVWTANYHGVKDISQTLYPRDSLMYFIHQCAGEGVYNKLGNKLYSLAITSLNYINCKDREAGILEASIAKQTNNAPYAFIDFESLRFVDGFRDKEFDAAMINKKRGKWLYIFDGIYYIRDQEVFDYTKY